MKSKISKGKDAQQTGAPPRALYHVYQKLNRLREIIASGECPTAARISERMEVSVRTVKRYLDNLRECGAPLENDRRRGIRHKGLIFYSKDSLFPSNSLIFTQIR